tara:strand:- start:98 stop:277 length:180 start_codon:yes stop_codon:yes gene_type:complete
MAKKKNKLWCERCNKDTEHTYNAYGWVVCDVCQFVGMFMSPDGKSIDFKKSTKNIDTKD